MRKLLLIGCIIVLAIGGPLTALAQTPVDPAAQAKIAAILAQHPNGGDALAAAIAQAVESDPTLAAAVVAAAATASPAQQQALGAGMAAAATFFANIAAAGGSDAAAASDALQLVATAMASAPASMQASFAANGGLAAEGSTIGSTTGNGGTGLTTSFDVRNCVSPSGPGGRC